VRSLGPAWTCVAVLASGCVYYNSLYNAEHLFDEGERERWAGRDSLAAARYQDVVRKAARGYREEPGGPWAAAALLLLGRARLRLGELEAAQAALTSAERVARDRETRLEARLYLGITLLNGGEVQEGTPLVSEALAGLRRGPAAAEGHLRRGGVLLAQGQPDTGWWDLEQAAVDRGLRTPAALERTRWSLAYGDSTRAHTSFDRLLAYREAGAVEDTVAALAGVAVARWGARVGAGFLAGVDTAAWESGPRGRIRLERAELLRAAGDSVAAEETARRVADGLGDSAAEARVFLARWHLAAASDLEAVRVATRTLLGSAQNPAVAPLLTALRRFDALTQQGLDRPLAWFAAAEIAREDLRAPGIARGLFLAYADAAPDDPWVPKALLAAMAVTDNEGDRAWLRGRLEGHAASPYVLAARGVPAPGIEDLEEELARRLQEIDTG
jgi:hypothetical protein